MLHCKIMTTIGMNFWIGKETLDSYDQEQAKIKLKKIWNRGLRELRVHHPPYNNDALIETDKLICLFAKEIGFRNQCCITADSYVYPQHKIGWATIEEFKTKGLEFVQWAAQTGAVDVVCAGNELELHLSPDMSFGQLRDQQVIYIQAMRQLITPSMKVDVNISQGADDTWNGINIASIGLDEIGLNLYGDGGSFTSFVNRATQFKSAHGTRAKITEYNSHYDKNQLPTDEDEQWFEINRRTQVLKDLGYKLIYPFTWMMYDDKFAFLKQDGTYAKCFQVIDPKTPRRNKHFFSLGSLS